MPSRHILIIENDAGLRDSWRRVLVGSGQEVTAVSGRAEALARPDLDEFEVIVSNLTDADIATPGLQAIDDATRRRLCATPPASDESASIVKAFKLDATRLAHSPHTPDELRELLELILKHKHDVVDDAALSPHIHEHLDFSLPSEISLMHPLLDYLLGRVAALGVAGKDNTHLFIALDEAFVNAVKHGNKFDATKTVCLTADLSAQEARFTIEDQGAGFDVRNIPDPCDPANLFKTSGRGVLLIHNIMDEVQYNERGNRITLVKKRPDEPL